MSPAPASPSCLWPATIFSDPRMAIGMTYYYKVSAVIKNGQIISVVFNEIILFSAY